MTQTGDDSRLIEPAKKKASIQLGSRPVKLPLTDAVGDKYGEWLLSQQGTISKDLELEF